MFDFEYHIKNLPNNPGVYLMKNNLGEIIYVGKAKILKNRVKSYFQKTENKSEKVNIMIKNISEFEYIVTDNEVEALILECNLIKKYSPKYNIALKDDKFYPFIKITSNDDFPRVFVTKKYYKDGSIYFGPYTNGNAVYETIDLINKLFPIRDCKLKITEKLNNYRPCLNYHIKRCFGPCCGNINKEEYNKMIKDIINLLSGKDTLIINDLKDKMNEASKNLEFEQAGNFRDKILAVENLVEKQKIFNTVDGDEDFINITSDENDSCIMIFFSRDGKIVGREQFIFENTANDTVEELLQDFISNFYGGTAKVPKIIYVPSMKNTKVLEEFLSIKRQSKVIVKVPIRGQKKEMLDLVKSNSTIMLEKFKEKYFRENEKNKEFLKELSSLLNLEVYPLRIEAYDISNTQGFDSVGTMIVIENGRNKNSDYRRFKIKSVKGSNDYESMREILKRRFERGLKEIKQLQNKEIKISNGKFFNFPDLIIMDGGKGQVNVAIEVLRELNIDIAVCGLVKDDKHKTRGIIYENKEIRVDKNSNLMNMITKIQDEVHRFAISYHRNVRDKRTLSSVLDNIPNIGEKRKRELLIKFGSIENIKKATKNELLETNLINLKCVESIINYFNNNE